MTTLTAPLIDKPAHSFATWRMRLLISLAQSRLRRVITLPLFIVLTVLHPFIHGTPLDGGALDGFLNLLCSQVIADTDEDHPDHPGHAEHVGHTHTKV